jgi:hypothetical protein
LLGWPDPNDVELPWSVDLAYCPKKRAQAFVRVDSTETEDSPRFRPTDDCAIPRQGDSVLDEAHRSRPEPSELAHHFLVAPADCSHGIESPGQQRPVVGAHCHLLEPQVRSRVQDHSMRVEHHWPAEHQPRQRDRLEQEPWVVVMNYISPPQELEDSAGELREELLAGPADGSDTVNLDPVVNIGGRESRTTSHEQISIDRENTARMALLDLRTGKIENVSLNPADVWPEPLRDVKDA